MLTGLLTIPRRSKSWFSHDFFYGLIVTNEYKSFVVHLCRKRKIL